MYRYSPQINILKLIIAIFLSCIFMLLVSSLRGWIFIPDIFAALVPLIAVLVPRSLGAVLVFVVGVLRDAFGSGIPSSLIFLALLVALWFASRFVEILSYIGMFWSAFFVGFITIVIQAFFEGVISADIVALCTIKSSITGLWGILLGYVVREERKKLLLG